MTSTVTPPALSMSGLAKAFGGNQVIRSFDLAVSTGMVLGLVGPNGAGKSTVFNLVTGFLRPDTGVVSLNGQTITGLSPRRISTLGVARTFQDIQVFRRMTVLENVMFSVESHPFGFRRVAAARAAAREVLEVVGLGALHRRLGGELSYGQQKFLSIGMAIARQPVVMLLDEPASGLDVNALEALRTLVEGQRAAGRTMVVIEHNLGFVRSLVDEVAFLDGGCVRAQGTPADIMSRPDLAEAYFGG